MSAELEDPPVTVISNKERRPSIMDMIKEKQNDQDFNQKLNVAITLVMELYRVLMGAFLVVFVPQLCDDTICSASQNINRDDNLSKSAISFNVITALSFLALYFVEVKRENKMINYLEVNRFTPVDNESVGKALEKLSCVRKQDIWDYDGYYQKSGYVSTAAFIINAVLSFIVVCNNYLDSKTITVFLTNILLMGLKVADVFSTVNTKKNVFYSAYLKNKVQFNDVDPDKIQLDDIQDPQVEELTETTPINVNDDIDQTESQSKHIEPDVESSYVTVPTQDDENTSLVVSTDNNDISSDTNEIFKDSHVGEQPIEIQVDAPVEQPVVQSVEDPVVQSVVQSVEQPVEPADNSV